jgi:hypothetical protein
MEKGLIKVSDDPAIDLPNKGEYRDENNNTLHGIYIRDYDNRQEKLFINNGSLMRKYQYPNIRTEFKSENVNDFNLHFCGEWNWPDVDHKYGLIDRVRRNLKPMGHIVCETRGGLNKLKHTIKYLKLNITTQEKVLGFCQQGTLKDLFDLGPLQKDYFNYLGHEAIDIRKIEDKTLDECITSFDYDNPTNEEELIITGLVFGYPIESTVSIILEEELK